MTPINESGITLSFPDNNFFRFQYCEGYKKLQNIQEMDCCWYDENKDTLYLIELKGWSSNKLVEEDGTNISQEEILKRKKGRNEGHIQDLFKKSVDSLFMFISILLNKPYSKNIQSCSPFTISNDTTIILLNIVDWKETDTTYIAMLNTTYQTKLKPYMKLMNIKNYNVLTKKQAKRQFAWVS